eukprot:TRINITY_DN90890_c0_g1_i1.p1 TRINITY_DN90890_c0_g1~~TRINITY_DN90890_c0_g1_i1.p1  ORF type:complete len:783 (+),score=174.35 TRINITY_DN90890_c0_g1_i1:69-2351(+)
MALTLRVRVSASTAAEAARECGQQGAEMCVCGGSPELGKWDPKHSPKLQLVENTGSCSVWEGSLSEPLAKSCPGQEFKFVVLNRARHVYVWESKHMHIMPEAGCKVTMDFNCADKDTHMKPVSASARSTNGYAAAGTGDVSRKLTVKFESPTIVGSGVVVVCGEVGHLGNWRPDHAMQMTKVDPHTWQADVAGRAGLEFKFVVVNGPFGVEWEERPNRKFAAGPEGHVHFFGSLESFEEEAASPRSRSPVRALKPEVVLDAAAEYWVPWESPSTSEGGIPQGALAPPRTMFHAFHWQFSEVKKRLKELKDLGFEAVQLSPAQKSKGGRQWWTRYQPQDYTQIEGLGSLEELRALGDLAKELGITLLGDAVFNHMIVVASGDDWKRAQKDASLLKTLQKRLADAVAPHLEVEDFQWPWFMMSGPHWDDDHRYEGWGNGEWSELRYCPKVVQLQQRHLKLLLDAGVRGIRFDAVKHMRPAHVGDYVKFLRESGLGIYSYGEVLSVDEPMHKEYMDALQLPSTDFPLTVYINRVLHSGVDAAEAGIRAAALAAASADGVEVGTTPADGGATTMAMDCGRAPLLSSDSVRFARNHDIVMNPGSFYGLKASCAEALPVWLWLLSVHDGTILMYPEDLFHADSSALLRRGLRFRQRMQRARSSKVCLSYSKRMQPPSLLTVQLVSSDGATEGLALVNLLTDTPLRVDKVPAKADGKLLLTQEDSTLLSIDGQGMLMDSAGARTSILLPPHGASFMLAGDSLGPASW